MRKTKLTYEIVAQAVELKRDGLCDADIIAALDVHQSTFYRWLKEGESAKSGVKRALYEELKKSSGATARGTGLTTFRTATTTRPTRCAAP